MRTVTGVSLVLAASLVLLPVRPAQAQIGGLIKRKAADAVKGKADKNEAKTVAKDDGPIKSQFEKECGPVTPEVIENFYRGLQAEAAGRRAHARKLAGTVPDDEVEACRQTETISPAAIAIIQRGLENGGTVDYVQKQMEKNREELEKHLVKKCGVRRSPIEQEQYKEYEAARKAGVSATGVNDNCYAKLKEFTLAFCKGLTPTQQKVATEQGIKVPGQGTDVFWVFTAQEAKAMFPRCGDLVRSVAETGEDVR